MRIFFEIPTEIGFAGRTRYVLEGDGEIVRDFTSY